MPVGHVLVGDARRDIEHDDTGLAVDVITVTKAAELLLPSRIPNIELDLTQILPRVLEMLFWPPLVPRTLLTYRREA